MSMSDKKRRIVYQKLIRDRIPEIIESHGDNSFCRTLHDQDFQAAAADKILEEAFELYRELARKNRDRVLTESADLLEIVLAALKPYGLDLPHVVDMMRQRAEIRGGFENHLFLEQVGGSKLCDIPMQRHPSMVFNPSQKQRLFTLLIGELERSSEVWIASAFYDPGAANLMMPAFSRFIEHGGKIRLLLSTMGNMVDPNYFTHLLKHIPGIFLKIFHPPGIAFDENPPNFHVKVWLFHHQEGFGALLTGSSNFTSAGLLRNVEWNYFSPMEVNLPFNSGDPPFFSAVNEFNRIWSQESVLVSPEFLAGYDRRFKRSSWTPPPSELFEKTSTWGTPIRHIAPNPAQQEALDNLDVFRKQGIRKAAVIAAPGIGKTYLAAFDFRQSGCRRLLFIVHRETILAGAMKTFRHVMNDPSFGAIHGSSQTAPPGCSAVFAMIQTLSRDNHLEEFIKNDFDYIVIDEFHHAEAAGYRKILRYFHPQFLLGLTATPERMDGRDVLVHCDYNIAFELRVLAAINRELLTPFQYFAIYDEIDYERITWKGSRYDEDELNNALINDTRTSVVARNLKKYLPSSGKIKALAFCSSVSHARYTAEKLTSEHGLPACALWSESTDEDRHYAIGRLETENDPLNVICTVDIFNEGVDIPRLSHVLFLRPTLSFTVFLQQLGRGLRKADGKDFLVVLDFVGNFHKTHVAPLALCGYTSVDDFTNESKVGLSKMLADLLPQGCYVSPDLEVRRIWDHEIKEIIDRKLSPADRLKNIYQNIKNDLGRETSMALTDIVANAYDADPTLFLKPEPFGNWLRAVKYCEGEHFPATLEKILDTPGEYFLQHIESGLNPVKSYKMVVLCCLLEMEGTEWHIPDIAKAFKQHYLQHRDQLHDYGALAEANDPETYPLSAVAAHLKNMPLNKLSNMETDCFALDRKNNRFRLKPEYAEYWQDAFFRKLVKDRVEFAMIRYFRRVAIADTK